ncbi:hypothetical protein [Mycobacterium szulgai]|uniref:hypothetical protein n=1 Tax=Mycobacterium szulgai TaxID=1787 RepID=UPI00111C2B28|nr:hypothetical protein [Mycobacterium szulgai]
MDALGAQAWVDPGLKSTASTARGLPALSGDPCRAANHQSTEQSLHLVLIWTARRSAAAGGAADGIYGGGGGGGSGLGTNPLTGETGNGSNGGTGTVLDGAGDLGSIGGGGADNPTPSGRPGPLGNGTDLGGGAGGWG